MIPDLAGRSRGELKGDWNRILRFLTPFARLTPFSRLIAPPEQNLDGVAPRHVVLDLQTCAEAVRGAAWSDWPSAHRHHDILVRCRPARVARNQRMGKRLILGFNMEYYCFFYIKLVFDYGSH